MFNKQTPKLVDLSILSLYRALGIGDPRHNQLTLQMASWSQDWGKEGGERDNNYGVQSGNWVIA